MAARQIIDLIIAAEAVLILVLLVFNAYFLAQPRILARIREIYFINSKALRQAWYLVISATTFFLITQVLNLLAGVGVAVDAAAASASATIFQLSFGSLILVAFSVVFAVFAKYIKRLNASEAEIDARVVEDMRRAMMRDDTEINMRLDLTRVGDVYSGRRQLGPSVSIGHYRAMAIGFATYMTEKLGHVGDAILYSVGRLTARQVAEEIFKETGSEAVALPRVFAEIRNQGIAIPEVAQRTEDWVDVILRENVTSAGIQSLGQAVCHYQAGMLAGLFEAMSGRRTLCRETKCWGLGDKYCEFRIDLEH